MQLDQIVRIFNYDPISNDRIVIVPGYTGISKRIIMTLVCGFKCSVIIGGHCSTVKETWQQLYCLGKYPVYQFSWVEGPNEITAKANFPMSDKAVCQALPQQMV